MSAIDDLLRTAKVDGDTSVVRTRWLRAARKERAADTTEYDLRVLWHCYTTDNRPPMDLQKRLTARFGVR